jgi:prolyl oligopeptidase
LLIEEPLQTLRKGFIPVSARKNIFSAGLVLLVACGSCKTLLPTVSSKARFTYPAARQDSVADEYHGVKVADPYRWLEDTQSDETQQWGAQQNRLTADFLVRVPAREKIRARLTQLLNYPRYSTPLKEAGRYFFYKNDGLQRQSVFYVQRSLESEPVVVINPNLLSEDGTVALTTSTVSKDGALLAYGLSGSGSDWQEIRIRRIDSGREYDETIRWCKFTSIAWKHSNEGFFYSRFPDPNTVSPEDQANYNHVRWHKLGSRPSEDPLVFERPDNKELSYAPLITEDGKFLILSVYHGTNPKNRIYYRPVDCNEAFVRLLDDADAMYSFIGNVGPVFYFRTDLNAPRGRLIAIDTNNPDRAVWQQIIPEQGDLLDFVALINNHFVAGYLHDVHHILRISDLSGTFVREVPLHSLGTVSGLSGKQDDAEMFFAFTSFLFPSTTYRYDFSTNQPTVLHSPAVDFDCSAYETKQVFCRSKDGTRIPMFITRRKDLRLDGNNPVLLYGYGGFNASLMPHFSTSTLLWLERGGVYAIANLRGGEEYGEQWHQAGMLDKKQNVFDDFIAAAEWLIENRYTNPKKLAIQGGSNGGLLVAACMLQRPKLYGAVICQVPVTDMLRYHKFTVGRFWIPEYGSAEASRREFDWLYAYSPLHNVKPGVNYPPVFILSADTDDRVVPAHAKKFVATLQAASPGRNPILLHVETKAGHGGGKPLDKIIDEQADIFAFLCKTLDMF